MYQTLLTSLENNILTVTINRPDKLNAINATVMSELNEVADEIYSNKEIRSAIITGAGAKAFVAGADISEFNGIQKEGRELSKKGQDIFFKIERSPKPVIAAVNGFALGAGCELAMSCHFRIASANAKFGQPEVNLGLLPGYGGTQRLVQLAGKGRAMEMLLSASMIDAATALQYGLVNHVTDQENLIAKAKEILNVINTKAPIALAACITAANAVFDETKEGYQLEAELFGECFATEDLKEGKAAFLEKRKASFKGR
ncbi:MAG: enoyl-CoA hydratase/isomerase family protein [Chitinophagaceae bacterium]|nr:enoyl-CoA hydratase/isomerase family protein [Chitinophagaceae bacterium]